MYVKSTRPSAKREVQKERSAKRDDQIARPRRAQTCKRSCNGWKDLSLMFHTFLPQNNYFSRKIRLNGIKQTDTRWGVLLNHLFSRKLSIVEKNAFNKKCVSRWVLQVIFGIFCEILNNGWDKRKQPWFLWFIVVSPWKSASLQFSLIYSESARQNT